MSSASHTSLQPDPSSPARSWGWPVVNPFHSPWSPRTPPLCGYQWAPHQGLPYWLSGIASSHSMAPHILPQSLEHCQKERGVCLSGRRLDYTSSQDPVWLNMCCFKWVADLICWKACYTTELLVDFSLKGKQLFLLICLIPAEKLDLNEAGWLHRSSTCWGEW